MTKVSSRQGVRFWGKRIRNTCIVFSKGAPFLKLWSGDIQIAQIWRKVQYRGKNITFKFFFFTPFEFYDVTAPSAYDLQYNKLLTLSIVFANIVEHKSILEVSVSVFYISLLQLSPI